VASLHHENRHLNTLLAGFRRESAPFQINAARQQQGTNMIDDRYFAELSSDEGAAGHYDNEVIEASSDQKAIGKAGAWAASHRLGVVATLILKQGVRGVHSRKIYLGA
jgi:hypothetical protein